MTISKPVPPVLPPTLPCPPAARIASGLLAAGPEFLAAVDARAARSGLDLGLVSAWGWAVAFTAQFAQVLAQAQRPTEKSARGVRCHAHVMGLPVVGGAR